MRCIGDPYGVGADCLHPSTAFVVGAIPDESGEPMVLMCPTCDVHRELVGDWVAVNSPLGDAHGYPWEFFDVVRTKLVEECGDVFVYTHAAA